MATSVRLIRRYVWLIDTIRQAKQITLEEINQKWMEERCIRMENEGAIPERTFHRHRQAIADLFGIDILCNRFGGNTYYIDNEEELSQPSFTSWLFNGLAIDNRLMHNEEIIARIAFEDTPGGNQFLSPIIEAMTKNRVISLTYTRFNSTDNKNWTVEPLGLKQSGRRWYLLAKQCGSPYPTVLALDRINSIKLEKDSFVPDPDINPTAYFEDVIGVNVDDYFGVQPVTLRVFGSQRAYIEALPIHKSQRLIARHTDYSDYSFTLRPEYEFQHAILRLGDEAEILSPDWLRKDMKWYAEAILKRYEQSK